MGRHLFLLCLGILIVPFHSLSQSKKEDQFADCPKIILHGLPCDSLYKIKGLKNVDCDNYVVARYEDVAAYAECFNQMNWNKLTKEEQERFREIQKEMMK
jgi:hypothetical protein